MNWHGSGWHAGSSTYTIIRSWNFATCQGAGKLLMNQPSLARASAPDNPIDAILCFKANISRAVTDQLTNLTD